MSFPLTILLGAIAGLTIFLGLPLARLRHPPRGLQAFLNAVATGILIFLLWDVITQATEPIEAALDDARGGAPGAFVGLLALFVGGFGVGLLGLVAFESRFLRRPVFGPPESGPAPRQLALLIATGIGLHNFSEGLAIGQAARLGVIGLAVTLIVGFGLHNMTEGFGIAAPLTAAGPPPWSFLGLAGLIGGGPTFAGTVLGYAVESPPIFVAFLALAAGSILYVVSELLHAGRRLGRRQLAMSGVFVGFMLGYGTDLILTWAGA